MGSPFVSWEGNKFHIQAAIGLIDRGDAARARLYLQDARNEIAPRTRPLPLKYKGAEGETLRPPDEHLYKALDEGFAEAIGLLPRQPDEARERLTRLKEQFGWDKAS